MENATSAPGASLIPDGIGAFTAAHLAILAILAVLTIAAIVYGAKLRRDRRHAEREQIERREEMAAQASVAEAEPVIAPPPPAQTPLPPPPAPASTSLAEPIASEPIPAAAPMTDNPALEAAAPETFSSTAPEDGSITQLKGLGPKVSARLAELGITTVGDMAALDADQAAQLDVELGAFRGRMARDRWIEQARFLAAGDRAGFEAVFGKL